MNITNSANSSNATGSPDNSGYSRGIEYQLLIGLLVVLVVTITVVNAFVILLVWWRRELRSFTNYALVSLASCDLLTGGVALPLVIAASVSRTYSLNLHLWMAFTQRFVAVCTIAHLVFITWERYIKLVRPLSYVVLISKRRLQLAIITIWLVSVLFTLVPLTWLGSEEEASNAHGRLILPDVIYDVVCLTVIVAFPFFFMLISFICIMRSLKDRRRTLEGLISSQRKSKILASQRRGEQRALIVVALMMLVFFLGWGPYFVLSLQIDLGAEALNLPPQVHFVLLFIKFSVGLFNPLLYTFLKSDFEDAVKTVLAKKASLRSLSTATTRSHASSTGHRESLL